MNVEKKRARQREHERAKTGAYKSAASVRDLADQFKALVDAGMGDLPVYAGGLIGVTQVSVPAGRARYDHVDPKTKTGQAWLDLDDVAIDDEGRAIPEAVMAKVDEDWPEKERGR